MTAKQFDMLKFVGVMIVVLLGMSVAFVVVLDIRLPWQAPPPPPTEPREFDLASLDTMVRQVDPARGLTAVKDLKTVAAASRCAIVVDSREEPTTAGHHYVFNALEFPKGKITAYPVQTEQLEQLVADCIAAGRAADGVLRATQDVASQARLSQLEADKEARREAEAEQPPEPEKKGSPIDMIKGVKSGDLDGVMKGFFKK